MGAFIYSLLLQHIAWAWVLYTKQRLFISSSGGQRFKGWCPYAGVGPLAGAQHSELSCHLKMPAALCGMYASVPAAQPLIQLHVNVPDEAADEQVLGGLWPSVQETRWSSRSLSVPCAPLQIIFDQLFCCFLLEKPSASDVC